MLVSRAMRSGRDRFAESRSRGAASCRPGRAVRWLLIVAALLLAVLSTVLWAKWEESRVRAERLQAEIKQVYAETEALRTQAARAQQRVAQLERQLREAPRSGARRVVRPKNPRASVARPLRGRAAPSDCCFVAWSQAARRRSFWLAGADGDAEVAGEADVGAVAHEDARFEEAPGGWPRRGHRP